MDRTEEYANQLARLKIEANNIIDKITDSENQLQATANLAVEHIKRAYIQQTNTLIDAMVQRRLNEIAERDQKTSSMIFETTVGILGVAAAHAADKSPLARAVAQPLIDTYHSSKIEEAEIREAAQRLKQRLQEQTLIMNRGEFIRSLTGGRTLHNSLRSMFNKELARTESERIQVR